MKRHLHVALITGAASGLGRAVAQHLSAQVDTLLLCDVNQAGLEETARGCSAGNAHTVKLDMTDEPAVAHAFASFSADGKTPDFIFHAAGILETGDLFSMEVAHARRMMEVNYLGTVHLLFHAGRHLKPGGRILCVSSVAGLKGLPEFAAYCGSKFAVLGFCESVHHDLKKRGIHLSVICPPAVDTPMVQNLKHRPVLYDIFPFAPKDVVVRSIVDAIERTGEFIILVDAQTRLLKTVNTLLPQSTSRVIGMLVDRWQNRAAR